MAKEEMKEQDAKGSEKKATDSTKNTKTKSAEASKTDKKNSKESGNKKKSSAKKSPKETKAEKELKLLKENFQEAQDKYMRLSAEFDNYRKRTLKEKMELTKNAGESIMISILPVVDNIERAINSINDSKDIDAMKEGINLIYSNFKDFLKQNGIKEIDSKHQEFDTDLHEAITKIPAPEEELKGKIVDVIEKGYTLNDKVIRYSKVVIGE